MTRSIREWQREAFQHAFRKGFHSDDYGMDYEAGALWHLRPERLASRLALIHSEVSEALECVTHGSLAPHKGEHGKPEGLPAELADVAIRLFDLCEAVGIDLEAAIAEKHAYNSTRPIRHGGKRL